jgi:hypothetical protein
MKGLFVNCETRKVKIVFAYPRSPLINKSNLPYKSLKGRKIEKFIFLEDTLNVVENLLIISEVKKMLSFSK